MLHYASTLRVRSIGKSGFRISNPTRNPKTDFNAEISFFGFSFLPFDWEIRKRIWKTVLKNSGLARARIISKKKTSVHENSFSKTDFNAEISFFGFSFLPFDWEIRKRIWKTVLKNSGLARARIISKKKTAVHANSFANPFWISQSNGKKEIQKIRIWIS